MSDDKLRLGGMALRNGLALFGPTSWAAAVRTADGGTTWNNLSGAGLSGLPAGAASDPVRDPGVTGRVSFCIS